MTAGPMHLPTLRLGLLAAFVADQATKAWALSALWPPYSHGMEVLPVLNLRLGFNTGVTFGMFRDSAAGAVWVLVAVSLLVVGTLLTWLWRTRSGAEALGLGLVIGGALGNIPDRPHPCARSAPPETHASDLRRRPAPPSLGLTGVDRGRRWHVDETYLKVG